MILAACLLAGGCLAERQSLRPDEVELAAWYVEDVAHGLDRDPFELLAEDNSNGLHGIALWAIGHVKDGRSIAHPTTLASRRLRWGMLADGLRREQIWRTPDGLLRLAGGVEPELRRILAAEVRQENLERLECAAILLSRGGLRRGSPQGERLLAALAEARRHHDAAAGGRLWEPAPAATPQDATSGSSSDDAATTSTSPPVDFPTRGL